MAIRRQPFEEMDRLFDQMRRSMVTGMPFWYPTNEEHEYGRERGLTGDDSNLSLEPTDDGYVVLADLPGFETEEIDLRFHDGMLTVVAEHEVTEEGGSMQSRRSRRVHERIHVPGDVTEDGISASYRNGVLEVHLPTVGDAEDEGVHIDIE